MKKTKKKQIPGHVTETKALSQINITENRMQQYTTADIVNNDSARGKATHIKSN